MKTNKRFHLFLLGNQISVSKRMIQIHRNITKNHSHKTTKKKSIISISIPLNSNNRIHNQNKNHILSSQYIKPQDKNPPVQLDYKLLIKQYQNNLMNNLLKKGKLKIKVIM